MHRGKAPLTSRYSPMETDYGLRMRIMARTYNGLEPARYGWTRWCGVHRWAPMRITGGRAAAINYLQYASYHCLRPVHKTDGTDGMMQDSEWRNNSGYDRTYLISYWLRWCIYPVDTLTTNHNGEPITIPPLTLDGQMHTHFHWGVDANHTWLRNWSQAWDTNPDIDARVSELPSNAFIRAMRDPTHPLYYRIALDLTETYLCGDRREIQAFNDTWRAATPSNIYAGWQNPVPGATRCLFSHAGIIIIKRIGNSSFVRDANGVIQYDGSGNPRIDSVSFDHKWTRFYHPLGWNPQDPAGNAQKFWVDEEGDLVPWVTFVIDEVVDPTRLDSQGRPELIYVRFQLQHLDWGIGSSRGFRTIQPLGKRLGQHWADAIALEPDARTRAIAKRFVNRLVELYTNIHDGEPLGTPLIGADGIDLRLPLTPEGHPKREVSFGMRDWRFNYSNHLTTLYGFGNLEATDRVMRIRTLRHADGTLDFNLITRIRGALWDNMGNILTLYPTYPLPNRPDGTAPPAFANWTRHNAQHHYMHALWMNHHANLLKAMNQYLSEIHPALGNIRWEFNSFNVPEVVWLFPRLEGTMTETERAARLWSPAKGNPRAGQNGQAWFTNFGNNTTNGDHYHHWIQALLAFNAWYALGFLKGITYESSPFTFYNISDYGAGDIHNASGIEIMRACLAGHGCIDDTNTPRSLWDTFSRQDYIIVIRLILGIGIPTVYWRFPDVNPERRQTPFRWKRATMLRVAQLLANMPDDLPMPALQECIRLLHGGGNVSSFPTSWVNEWVATVPALGINTTLGWRERISIFEQHNGSTMLLYDTRPNTASLQQQMTKLKPFVIWHPYSTEIGDYTPRMAVNSEVIINHQPGTPAIPPTTTAS